MSKTIELSITQVETLIQEGYQAALNDLYSLDILKSPQNRNPEVLKEMEHSITTFAKGSFDRYYNCQQNESKQS